MTRNDVEYLNLGEFSFADAEHDLRRVFSC